ncbi:MAG: glycine cleavage system protein GcvH [Deltaproteobacteria bacterium]|nr:MAG: glycine cleavage system protein GcvH [Deltaproteobacteria bacterium]
MWSVTEASLEEYEIPERLRYTREHEWARLEENRIIVGVTDYAQRELGDIVFVELPAAGTAVEAGEPFGVIESVKAVSDLYAPVTGEIVEVNSGLVERPEAVNEDCYGDGWLVAVGVESSDEYEALLDAEAYRQHLAETKR